MWISILFWKVDNEVWIKKSLSYSLQIESDHVSKSYLKGHQIYVMGGYNSKDGRLKSCEMYDIKQNKWIDIAPMSYQRGEFGSVSRGKIKI